MKFLIQTIDGLIKFDFELELINSIEAHNFYYPDDKISYVMGEFSERISNPTNICPVGSVEFVREFFKIHFGDEYVPKPINIPQELMLHNFAGRYVDNVYVDNEFKEKHSFFSIDLFVKSNDEIKCVNNGIYHNGFIDIPNGYYQVSKLFQEGFKAEFRCFVFEKTLLDVRRYIGDFKIFPDFKKIYEMIDAYKSCPHVYTLDVGVTDKGETVVIEVHDFFSCGLYGFMRTEKLPYMFWRWYFYYLKSKHLI